MLGLSDYCSIFEAKVLTRVSVSDRLIFMKKNLVWILVVVVLVVLVLGYLGRHKIKSMLGVYSSPTQTTTTNSYVSPTSTQSATAPSDNIYKTMTDTTKGSYLVDFQGMTLYTYDKDTKGVSNCSGACATNWPPYSSGATAETTLPENVTVITRTDGTKQFAWKGMPLYYFAKDTKAGDLNGDGVGGVWHLVKP